MKITVFDYGAGNLHSLGKALALRGASVAIEPDPLRALDSDLLVLPGVGAFASAAGRLAPGRDRMRAAIGHGLPCLGICLGMQLLFESSEEGPGAGLGVIRGSVTRLAARKVPQIGWNAVEPVDPDETPPVFAYYAHSFACRPHDESLVRAWTSYETDRFPAVVRAGRIIGVQFHPEKSGRAGVGYLLQCVDTLTGSGRGAVAVGPGAAGERLEDSACT